MPDFIVAALLGTDEARPADGVELADQTPPPERVRGGSGSLFMLELLPRLEKRPVFRRFFRILIHVRRSSN
jgi:hypothetical protein